MLHDGHELDGIVPQILHVGQHVVGKLPIGGDAVILAGHADMGLIDQRRLVAAEIPVRPGIGLQIIPHLAAPALMHPVLGDALGVERDMLGEAVPIAHDGDHPAALAQGIPRQEQLPIAVIGAVQGRIRPMPVVEIAGQIDFVRAGGPLAVDPAVRLMMKAEIAVGVGKVPQTPIPRQLTQFALIAIHAKVEIALIGLQIWEFFQDMIHGFSLLWVYSLVSVYHMRAFFPSGLYTVLYVVHRNRPLICYLKRHGFTIFGQNRKFP